MTDQPFSATSVAATTALMRTVVEESVRAVESVTPGRVGSRSELAFRNVLAPCNQTRVPCELLFSDGAATPGSGPVAPEGDLMNVRRSRSTIFATCIGDER